MIMLCSVCIATYKRPEYLKELLESLERQKLPSDVSVEIIVVENDSEQSAKSVVEKFKDNSAFEIHYYLQPEKNISKTRNLAVKKASGEYLLFIDDDETASEKWIIKLLETSKKFEADGVFGLVEPIFHRDTPDWMKNRELFYSPMTKTGTIARYTFTSNCLIKAELLKKTDSPFNPEYGVTGGEDVTLFYSLAEAGAKFVNCREAIVYEKLLPERTNLSYILRRSMRGGNTHTRRLIENAGRKNFFVRIFMLFKSLLYGFISFIMVLIFYPNKLKRTEWLIRLASNAGRFLAVFDWHYKGYK